MSRTKKHMSKQDLEDWDALYEFVRTNVLGYDKNQSLSSTMVLRLKGLLNNKFMANNNTKDTANYSYKVVLNTFKFSMPIIKRKLETVSFTDENHKFNYILKIVESNLNTVYIRMKNAEKTREEESKHDISDAANYINTFKPKENKHNNSNLDDLW